jgi:hypothetical protein
LLLRSAERLARSSDRTRLLVLLDRKGCASLELQQIRWGTVDAGRTNRNGRSIYTNSRWCVSHDFIYFHTPPRRWWPTNFTLDCIWQEFLYDSILVSWYAFTYTFCLHAFMPSKCWPCIQNLAYPIIAKR